MGFNGDIVVLRSERPLSAHTPYADTPQHLTGTTWNYLEGWRAVHVRHYEAPSTYADAWIAELAQATQAPVLVCHVRESDVAQVRGSSGAGWWEGWLDPESASSTIAAERYSAFMEENYEGVDSMQNVDLGQLITGWEAEALLTLERERSTAAHAAVAWAAAAGHSVPVEPVEQLLARSREPFVEDLFFALLNALGMRRLAEQ